MPRTARTRPETPDAGAWKLFYSVTEAAAATGVSRETLLAAVRSGDLDHRWLSAQKILIRRDALLAWFEALPQDRPTT